LIYLTIWILSKQQYFIATTLIVADWSTMLIIILFTPLHQVQTIK
jgi:hypothetical protein